MLSLRNILAQRLTVSACRCCSLPWAGHKRDVVTITPCVEIGSMRRTFSSHDVRPCIGICASKTCTLPLLHALQQMCHTIT